MTNLQKIRFMKILNCLLRIYEGMRKISGLRMEGELFQEVGLIAEIRSLQNLCIALVNLNC